MHRNRFSKLARVGTLSLAFVAAPLAGISAGQADAPSTGTGTGTGAGGGTGTGAGGGTSGGGTTTGGGTSARAEDHDHGTDWGWVGLLGLAGLAGLARRKDRDHVHVAPGTARH